MATAVALLLIAPLVCGLASWLVRAREGTLILPLAGATTALVSALYIAARVQEQGPQYAFGEWIYVDSLSVVVLVLTATVGLCGVINSRAYIAHDVEEGSLSAPDARRYFALVLLFLTTMLAVPLVNNLGVMWVAIEMTTVVSVLLVSTYRTGPALEAAWKYLVIGSVGIALALFGTMMAYYASVSLTGEATHELTWTGLLAISGELDPAVMRLAFAFVLVGYGTKVGLAPMHTWLPDAHSQAPSPVSGLLSGVLLNCAVYAILRFKVLTDGAAGASYGDHLLIAFGVFSLTISIPFLLVQHDLKRLLAYGSVEHMGLIVLAFGIGGPIALYAAMLHMVGHTLAKSTLFFASGAVVQAFRTRSMHRLRGLGRLAPVAAAALMAGSLALGGLPPFAIFTAEYGLVAGAFSHGRGGLGVAAIVLASVAAGCFLWQIIQIVYKESSPRAERHPMAATGVLSLVVPLALLAWISVAPPDRFEKALDEAVAVLEQQ